MTIENKMERYSVITGKNPREIVLLRGSGCKWRRCRFCDYHLDFSKDETANFALNSAELFRITGVYHHLEVINSGSFIDLDADTLSAIKAVCTSKSIKTIHFECHWQDRSAIKALREDFDKIGVDVKVKIGVETFDPSSEKAIWTKALTKRTLQRLRKNSTNAVCFSAYRDRQKNPWNATSKQVLQTLSVYASTSWPKTASQSNPTFA